MKKYLLGVSVAVLVLAGHVQAADVVQTYEAPEVAPVAVVPAFGWGGVYVGGQLGGSWGDGDVSADMAGGSYIIPSMVSLPLTSGHLFDFSPDPSGFVGGLYAGYNFDLGNDIILGLETDFVWGDVDDQSGYQSFNLSTIGGTDYLNARVNLKQKWAGATRIRVGYAMDRFLPYVAAGVAYSKIEGSGHAYISATPGGSPLGSPVPEYDFRGGGTFTGWTVGTGADYAVTDNVLLRLEYRYADYGDKSYRYVIPGGGTAAIDYDIDYKSHDVRVGVAYKF